MKKLLTAMLIVLVAQLAAAASAHEGMIALYSDPSANSCQVDLPQFQLVNLSLFYIRGDGPKFAGACEFRLSKSVDGIQFGMPVWNPNHGLAISLGQLATGIVVAFHAGENPSWCLTNGYEDNCLLGTIPVLNMSESGPFIISVIDSPLQRIHPGIYIAECSTGFPQRRVIGGTFVFNGDCYIPEDPFGTALGIETSTWGAIKEIFSE